MQVEPMVRQTYGRPVAIVGHNTKLAAELVSEPDIKVDLTARPKTSFVDKVMYSLEREDTMVEQLIGYGVCALAVLYLLGNLLRAFLHMVA